MNTGRSMPTGIKAGKFTVQHWSLLRKTWTLTSLCAFGDGSLNYPQTNDCVRNGLFASKGMNTPGGPLQQLPGNKIIGVRTPLIYETHKKTNIPVQYCSNNEYQPVSVLFRCYSLVNQSHVEGEQNKCLVAPWLLWAFAYKKFEKKQAQLGEVERV